MFEITSRFLDLQFCDGCRYTNERSRRDHLEASVRSSQDAMNLTDAQNRACPADLLTILDTERTLFTNQELLARSQDCGRCPPCRPIQSLGRRLAVISAGSQGGSNGRSTAMAELRAPKP